MHRHVATRTLRLIAVMLFGLGLAACGDDGDDAASTTSTVSESADDASETTVDETPTTSDEQVRSSVVVSGTGLIVNTTGDPLTINFGADRTDVIDAVTIALGAAPNESDGSPECPNAQASVATWPDLILDFDANDRFLSWRLPGGSQLTDADGHGLGSTRSDLDDAMLASIEETSLGTEFGKTGSVSGLLSGPEDAATVDVLWAGDICAFR